jgi:hypothetical protein
MRKSLAVFPLLALLAACSGGGSNNAMLPGVSAQSGTTHTGGAVRHTKAITNFNYTLASASYPTCHRAEATRPRSSRSAAARK